MQNKFIKIISVGIKPNYTADMIEKTKLVNGISLVGVPVCFFLSCLFLFSGLFIHAISFAFGVLVFLSTLPINKYFGLKTARAFICIMAPACFAFVNVISGKDAGFYMGFIVTTIPNLLVFDSKRDSFIFIGISIFFLTLSLIVSYFVPPIAEIKFAMMLHVVNLFTVLIATLAVVVIFKKELNESKAKIEEKQEEILDSIHYAKRIQNTLITNKEFINTNLPNNFIYFQPKDIVSGDFYWATKKDEYFYLAVCDSTGHGVPGAFMSLMNITFLNEAINQKNISDVAEVFNYVRERLIENLGKDGQKDGFDGILICIKKGFNELSYVAANNAPVLVSSNEIVALPYDKMPVGHGEKQDHFTKHTVTLKQNEVMYLYTDGYADQFGGPKGKKFMYKQLDEMLKKVCTQPMQAQEQTLHQTFQSWKGEHEQVDDVCVIGIRI